MKKYCSGFCLFFLLQLLNAQEVNDFSKQTEATTEKSTDSSSTIGEEAPIFPGCESLSFKERLQCLNKKVQMHAVRKFNSSIADTLGLTQGKYKVYIFFRINELGVVDSIRSKAPHPALKAEAIRVAQELPKMVPGKSNGKNVSVKFTLPISFYVDKPKRKRKRKNQN